MIIFSTKLHKNMKTTTFLSPTTTSNFDSNTGFSNLGYVYPRNYATGIHEKWVHLRFLENIFYRFASPKFIFIEYLTSPKKKFYRKNLSSKFDFIENKFNRIHNQPKIRSAEITIHPI